MDCMDTVCPLARLPVSPMLPNRSASGREICESPLWCIASAASRQWVGGLVGRDSSDIKKGDAEIALTY